MISRPFSGTLCKTSLRAVEARGKNGGMNMKLISTFAVLSLCVAGTACSESTQAEDTTAVVATETAQVEDDYSGSLNLSLPSSSLPESSETGSLNLRIGQSGDEDGLLIGSGGFGGGQFEDAPSLGLSLPGEEAAAAQPSEDDIIRLDPK